MKEMPTTVVWQGRSASDEPEIVTGFHPGYLGRIAEMHGVYYAEVWGSGPAFEALMARDLLLTAHADGLLVSSIAIDGSQPERPGAARLRWFLTEPAYQGRGIGRRLFEQAMAFCQERGFPSVYLWTVEGLLQSWGMYERAGFRVIERHPDGRYSVPHIHVQMERALSR